MEEELQRAANAKLGTGTTFIGQTWGLSETTGAVTAMPKGEMEYVFLRSIFFGFNLLFQLFRYI